MGEWASVPMVSLYSISKQKTYEFGWILVNGTFAEILTPLWQKNPKSSLRVYHYDKDKLSNGLPNPDELAPEGMFIEGFDTFFRYHVDIEDIDYPGVGLWKLIACKE